MFRAWWRWWVVLGLLAVLPCSLGVLAFAQRAMQWLTDDIVPGLTDDNLRLLYWGMGPEQVKYLFGPPVYQSPDMYEMTWIGKDVPMDVYEGLAAHEVAEGWIAKLPKHGDHSIYRARLIFVRGRLIAARVDRPGLFGTGHAIEDVALPQTRLTRVREWLGW